jgi:hypothetical protein
MYADPKRTRTLLPEYFYCHRIAATQRKQKLLIDSANNRNRATRYAGYRVSNTHRRAFQKQY